MLGIIIRLLVTALAALLTAYLLPGVKLQDFTTALLLAIVLGLLNLIVKPILVILTLPVTVVTLGLFLLVINALIVLWASSLVKGFKVDSFWWALLFSVVLSLISSFMMSLGPEDKMD
ncbi:phage holin family protein [Chitinophaga deserti]|uniref:phage holin family protein n=1 Tax=Chitinophaga deserti TaxID=2164099 RepID=UPI000D6D3AFD|nr:phage holin family protein [Chitinophaga deserti]